MKLHAALTTLLLSAFLTISATAQYSTMIAGPHRMSPSSGSVSGTVVGAQREVAAGVRVELQDIYTRATVASAYTRQDGTFELYNIPSGHYQIVAQSGVLQAMDSVSVGFGQVTVALRFENAAPGYGDRNSVTVAEMMVPKKARSLYLKARDAYARGKLDDAEKLVDRALNLYPNFAEALTLRGLIQMRSNQIDQAREAFEQAIQADPNYSMAYLALASVYNAQAKYDDALRTLEHETTISPTAWQGYYEMARASIGKGLYGKALQLAEKAGQMGGDGIAALHLVKASAMIPLKLYGRAKQELQAYLQREPSGRQAEQVRTVLARLDAADADVGVATNAH